MTEVTAEMIAGRRAADPRIAAKPSSLAIALRKAREKLSRSGSGHRDFDIALLRLFAKGRRASGSAMAILSGVAAAIAVAWVPLDAVLIWLCANIAALSLGHRLAGKFLNAPDASIDVDRWRRNFVIAEMVQGVAWAILICLISHPADPAARACVLVMLLLVAAMNATITASIPAAAQAGLTPVALTILIVMRPASLSDGTLPLVAVACGTLLYFMHLARKLHAASLEALSFQAEKDELIAELEQSKANSDLARRRAEEANLAKSRFLATMSHELRTPLNAILGFSEVMKGELFGSHIIASYKEYSTDIHSSGQHLLMLINEILDLSRIEAGRFDLKEEPVALPHIVEDCRHLLSLRAKKRNIDIEEAVEPTLPRLWADERAVRQVTLNLLSNAIKFTPPGGKITIKIGWTSSGGQYFAVRDSGPGIPEEEIPIVMSSFGRGTLAQKNADEGSGLGLPIVKGLVELHGGSFTLKSKLREGTEVIVIFPPERVMDAAPIAEPDAFAAKARRKTRSAA
ncbi:sensor histidine kinase [Methylocapsa aurea]|uniref:sensor histidine kinase n=1 Tax=Methylocapsa aurea TaxID=663610 RepID=UPI00056B0C83|nr:HAMP domain-containing sensor histidine kinase [Methylocapsa aurea]